MRDRLDMLLAQGDVSICVSLVKEQVSPEDIVSRPSDNLYWQKIAVNGSSGQNIKQKIPLGYPESSTFESRDLESGILHQLRDVIVPGGNYLNLISDVIDPLPLNDSLDHSSILRDFLSFMDYLSAYQNQIMRVGVWDYDLIIADLERVRRFMDDSASEKQLQRASGFKPTWSI